jgi:transcriptional regulator with XRE-family HTH domain
MSAALDLGTVLALLREIRGLDQKELAKASGLTAGTISDFERGKMVPGLNSVEKLLTAMSYDFAAVDKTQEFVNLIRSQQQDVPAAVPLSPSAREREIAEVTAAAGRVVARLVKLFFNVLIQRAEK